MAHGGLEALCHNGFGAPCLQPVRHWFAQSLMPCGIRCATICKWLILRYEQAAARRATKQGPTALLASSAASRPGRWSRASRPRLARPRRQSRSGCEPCASHRPWPACAAPLGGAAASAIVGDPQQREEAASRAWQWGSCGRQACTTRHRESARRPSQEQVTGQGNARAPDVHGARFSGT